MEMLKSKTEERYGISPITQTLPDIRAWNAVAMAVKCAVAAQQVIERLEAEDDA